MHDKRPDNLDLTYLSTGELLWVHRRRLGLTQYKMARKLCVGRNKYKAWELDHEDCAIGGLTLKPTLYEKLGLARRRLGYGLWPIAEKLGCSHMTLLKLEREQHPRLQGFYEKRWGFTFGR